MLKLNLLSYKFQDNIGSPFKLELKVLLHTPFLKEIHICMEKLLPEELWGQNANVILHLKVNNIF